MVNNQQQQQRKPYDQIPMEDDYFGINKSSPMDRSAEVDPNSFLGMANMQQQQAPEQAPAPTQQDEYVNNLNRIENSYQASEWDTAEKKSIKSTIPQPSAVDRIFDTLFDMGTAFLLSGGNPAAMALAGYARYTNDEDREYRYNRIDQYEADGYSRDAIEAWVDSGDKRYLSEDYQNRVAADKEQWNREVNVRDFDEGVRQYEQNFGLETEKFGETQRHNKASEAVSQGNLAVNQAQLAWNTREDRVADIKSDDNGNIYYTGPTGDVIKIINNQGQEVGTGGAKVSTSPAADKGAELNVWDETLGTYVNKVKGTPGKYQEVGTGNALKINLDEKLDDGSPRYQLLNDASLNQKLRIQEGREKVWSAEEKDLDKQKGFIQANSDALKGISEADIDKVTGLGSYAPSMTKAAREAEAKFTQLFSQEFTKQIAQVPLKGSLSNAEGSKLTSAGAALLDNNGEMKEGLGKDYVRYHVDRALVGNENLQKVLDYKKANRGKEPSEEWKAKNFTKDTQFVQNYEEKRGIGQHSRYNKEMEARNDANRQGTPYAVGTRTGQRSGKYRGADGTVYVVENGVIVG